MTMKKRIASQIWDLYNTYLLNVPTPPDSSFKAHAIDAMHYALTYNEYVLREYYGKLSEKQTENSPEAEEQLVISVTKFLADEPSEYGLWEYPYSDSDRERIFKKARAVIALVRRETSQ